MKHMKRERSTSLPIAAFRRKDWVAFREKLEAAFNVFVYKITPGKNRRRVLVYAVPADEGLPQKLEWSSVHLINDDFTLSLGRGLQGIVTIDLAVAPHVLIGGSTGSGKSVLLKNLLMQCVFKGSDVYIADFKGGLDFPRVWWEKAQVIIEPVKFLQKLQKIEAEMKHRIEVLRKAVKRNLHDYNFIHSEYRYPRIVIACDEAGCSYLIGLAAPKRKKRSSSRLPNIWRCLRVKAVRSVFTSC